jgi:hypothetical protein
LISNAIHKTEFYKKIKKFKNLLWYSTLNMALMLNAFAPEFVPINLTGSIRTISPNNTYQKREYRSSPLFMQEKFAVSSKQTAILTSGFKMSQTSRNPNIPQRAVSEGNRDCNNATPKSTYVSPPSTYPQSSQKKFDFRTMQSVTPPSFEQFVYHPEMPMVLPPMYNPFPSQMVFLPGVLPPIFPEVLAPSQFVPVMKSPVNELPTISSYTPVPITPSTVKRIISKRIDLARFARILINSKLDLFLRSGETSNRKKLFEVFKSGSNAVAFGRINDLMAQHVSDDQGAKMVNEKGLSPMLVLFKGLENEILVTSIGKMKKDLTNKTQRETPNGERSSDRELFEKLQSYDIITSIAKDWNNLQMVFADVIPMGIISNHVSEKSERGQVIDKKILRSFINELMKSTNSILRYGVCKCIFGILSNIIHHLDYWSDEMVRKLILKLHECKAEHRFPRNDRFATNYLKTLDIKLCSILKPKERQMMSFTIENYLPHFHMDDPLYDQFQYQFMLLLSDAIRQSLMPFKCRNFTRKYQLGIVGLLRCTEILSTQVPDLHELIYTQPFSLFTR